MKLTHLTLGSALAIAVAVGAFAPEHAGAADAKVKLSGCVVKGDGDGAGYLLTNSPVEPSFQTTAESHAAPSGVGTTGAFTHIFYWLDGDRDLRKHVGHQVEVEGYVKGDVKEGELKVERKEAWTEMTVKADGRTMKASVPNGSVVADNDPDHKMSVLVRKVDVDHVKMIGASCQ